MWEGGQELEPAGAEGPGGAKAAARAGGFGAQAGGAGAAGARRSATAAAGGPGAHRLHRGIDASGKAPSGGGAGGVSGVIWSRWGTAAAEQRGFPHVGGGGVCLGMVLPHGAWQTCSSSDLVCVCGSGSLESRRSPPGVPGLTTRGEQAAGEESAGLLSALVKEGAARGAPRSSTAEPRVGLSLVKKREGNRCDAGKNARRRQLGGGLRLASSRRCS